MGSWIKRLGGPVILVFLCMATSTVANALQSGNSVESLETRMEEMKTEIKSIDSKLMDLQVTELKWFKNFMNNMRCEKGDRGAMGPKGEAGPTGPAGPQGRPGLPGTVPAELSGTKMTALMDKISQLTRNSESLLRQSPLRSCGGIITLSGNSEEVIYQLSSNASSEYGETCAWVVWAAHGGPIEVKIKSSSPLSRFQNGAKLYVVHNVSKAESKVQTWSLVQSAADTTVTYTGPFVEIFFNGKPSNAGLGIHFQVTDKGQTHRLVEPTMVTLDASSQSYKYKFPPPPQTEYQPHERLFVLIKGKRGAYTRVKINNVDFESCCDWLDGSHLNLTRTHTTSSMVYRVPHVHSSVDYTSPTKNVPFVIHFHSDGSVQKSGFNLEYFYTSS